MTPAQSILYAVALFVALASLLRWKHRREVKFDRMRRSLRIYSARVLAEMSGEFVQRWPEAIRRAA